MGTNRDRGGARRENSRDGVTDERDDAQDDGATEAGIVEVDGDGDRGRARQLRQRPAPGRHRRRLRPDSPARLVTCTAGHPDSPSAEAAAQEGMEIRSTQNPGAAVEVGV